MVRGEVFQPAYRTTKLGVQWDDAGSRTDRRDAMTGRQVVKGSISDAEPETVDRLYSLSVPKQIQLGNNWNDYKTGGNVVFVNEKGRVGEQIS